jgi:hypothetical protein
MARAAHAAQDAPPARAEVAESAQNRAEPTPPLRCAREAPIIEVVTVPGLGPRTAADLSRAREEIEWVVDDDLRDLESKSTPGATALGLFTWGGSHLYLGELRAGIAGIAALGAWIAVAPMVPTGLGALGYWLVGAASALWSFRRARAVNRFVGVRNELRLYQGPDPSTYRLLAAAAVANPTLASALPALPAPPPPSAAHAGLIEQLRKLAALHRAGVLHDTELRDRKVDLFTEAAPATRAELDDLLYALLPLAAEGALLAEDFEFVKQIGSSGGGGDP